MKNKQRADHEGMDREKREQWRNNGVKVFRVEVTGRDTRHIDDMIERGVVENSYNQVV